jgi:hypothetical protein
MTERDFESAGNRRQIKPFPKIQFFTFNNHLLRSRITFHVSRVMRETENVKRG